MVNVKYGKVWDNVFKGSINMMSYAMKEALPVLEDFLTRLEPDIIFEDEPDKSERKEMTQKEVMELGKEMFWENQIELWNRKKEVEKRRWI